MAGLHGLIRAELEKGPLSSQKPCRQGKTAKGYREKVGLRNIGQGDSADLSAPETSPSYGFLPACQQRKVLGSNLKDSHKMILGENSDMKL